MAKMAKFVIGGKIRSRSDFATNHLFCHLTGTYSTFYDKILPYNRRNLILPSITYFATLWQKWQNL